MNLYILSVVGFALFFVAALMLYLVNKQKIELAHQKLQELLQTQAELEAGLAQKNNEYLEIKEKYITEKTQKESLLSQMEANQKNQQAFKESIENQFKLIAQNILEQKSQSFKNIQLEELEKVIRPFKADVLKLEKRVNEVHDAENKQRASLEKTIENLISISSEMKLEANRLSTAIISDNKQQGNWGEFALERLFESAGLRAGIHYETQRQFRDADGGIFQPDVVIHLPDNKKVIVDSKVSIKHYYESLSAETESQKKALLKQHYLSVIHHIKSLSDKHYTEKITDAFHYVLMFIPFESGLQVAMDEDPELYDKAVKQNILLVTPSTLLVSLTAIRALWQSEHQRQNIVKIAKQGSKIYDKARGFIEDLEGVGKSLKQLETKYEGAKNKLYTGRGNLVALSERMKKMGVSVKKSIDSSVLDTAELSQTKASPSLQSEPQPTEYQDSTPINNEFVSDKSHS